MCVHACARSAMCTSRVRRFPSLWGAPTAARGGPGHGAMGDLLTSTGGGTEARADGPRLSIIKARADGPRLSITKARADGTHTGGRQIGRASRRVRV